MRLGHAPRALTSWVAILAILMAALAPSVSHALAAHGSVAWIEVCSALGSKWVRADAPEREPASGSSGVQALEHCPYCTLQDHAPALPASRSNENLCAAPGLDPLAARIAAPQTAAVWHRAQPRAPPVHS